MRVLYIFWIPFLYQICVLPVLSICGLSFHFLYKDLKGRNLKFWWSPAYQFCSFMICAFWVLSKNSLLNSRSQRFFCVCSRSFIVLGFTFRQLQVNFVYVVWSMGGGPLSFAHGCWIVPGPFVEKISISCGITVAHSLEINQPHMCGSISGLFLLFHWSLCLSFC